ncbi:hypothetical protein DLAC_11444 [Tieghemostelium lacteum]|uniref:Ankyrin repeat-containing protein n=1 Tax=Tieghemostelium lacteum TaxID=361077 RepID=A0A152AA74_TIELA|nr:hypothetical protein DLAC_11444 [Tieghemostelium lacteum]|eukprot:KYR03031.1 hypothetical protein DLAC_11444 [Tieghemostelium lacteum]
MGYNTLQHLLVFIEDFSSYINVYQHYNTLFHSDNSKDKSLEYHASNKKPNIEIVKHLRNVIGCKVNSDVILQLIYNDKDILKYLIDGMTSDELSLIELDRLYEFPDIETANLMINTFPSTKFNQSLNHSSLEVIQHLHQLQRDEMFNIDVMHNRAANGDMETVKFLHYNRNEGCEVYTLDVVAANGDLEMFKFLFENRKEPYSQESLIKAATNKHWNIVKYIYNNFSKRDPYINIYAVGFDKNNKCTYTRRSVKLSTYNYPAFQNSVNYDVTKRAFEQSNLEMLEFLFNHGKLSFGLDFEFICQSVEVVNFLKKNMKLFFNEDILAQYLVQYARDNNMEMIEYIYNSTNYKLNEICDPDIMDNAASNGNLKLLKFLHYNTNQGCSTNAMDNGSLEVVKFLHENRSEGCTTYAMDNGSLEVVKFLHENRSEGCSIKALCKPDESKYQEVLQYLLTNRPELKNYNPTDYIRDSQNLESFKFYFHQIHNQTSHCEWENLIPIYLPSALRYLFQYYPKVFEGWSNNGYDQLLSYLVNNGFIKLIQLLNLQNYLSIQTSFNLLKNSPTTLAVQLIKSSKIQLNQEFHKMLQYQGYFHLINLFK